LSLRTRLYVVLGALFLVPILVGALVLAFVVPNIGGDLLDDRIEGSAVVVRSEIGDDCNMLGLAARSVALESALATPAKAVASAISGGYASYAAVLAPDGSVVEDDGRLPEGTGPAADLSPCTWQWYRSRASPARNAPSPFCPWTACSPAGWPAARARVAMWSC
jgi:hypothetical protein